MSLYTVDKCSVGYVYFDIIDSDSGDRLILYFVVIRTDSKLD